MHPSRLLAALTLLLSFVGCVIGGGGATAGSLRRRASFDLKCPEEEVQLVELDGQCGCVTMGDNPTCTMGATGCGQQLTYIKTHHTWVLNSSTR